MVKRGVGTFVTALGLLCLAAALLLTVFNIRTDTAALAANSELLTQLRAAEPDGRADTLPASPALTVLPAAAPIRTAAAEETDPAAMSTVEINGRQYVGTITIPVFGLELPVMDECTDESLAVAPGRLAGSVRTGALVIGGHNYISHFGRLNRLREGNEILFTDVDGNKTLYEVAGAEVIDGTAGDLLVTDEWVLSLFTCTFSGSQRYVVRCVEAER